MRSDIYLLGLLVFCLVGCVAKSPTAAGQGKLDAPVSSKPLGERRLLGRSKSR